MKRPEALLWDWDNTLVDAWAGVAAALNAAFAGFAMPAWTPEQTKQRVRASLRDSFPAIFGPDWRRARDLFYAALEEGHLDHVAPLAGAAEALAAGQGLPQGVVSNKTGRFLRAEIAHLGWEPFFAAVVGAGDARGDKPSPEPILLALERMGAQPGPEIWYLGDTALDMVTARNAGVAAVLVGDAAHDGGIARVSPDAHFANARAVAVALRGWREALPGASASEPIWSAPR